MRRTTTSPEMVCPAAEITLPRQPFPRAWRPLWSKHPPAQNSFSEQSWIFGVGDRVAHPLGVLGKGYWLVGKGWDQGQLCLEQGGSVLWH